MKCLYVGFAAIAILFTSCVNRSQGPVQTYADLEASMWRRHYQYQSSQLTNHPLRDPGWRDREFTLFFQLPLRERVIDIMTSFARVQTDGETGEMLSAMLHYRGDAKSYWQPKGDMIVGGNPTPEDRAYTRAIFRTIDGFSEEKVRRFCAAAGGGEEDKSYALFQKNLKNWKEWCDYHG